MQSILLEAECSIKRGTINPGLVPDATRFEELWSQHPDHFSEISIHGRAVKVPRWDRAYEQDYPFSNQVAPAHPVPAGFEVFLVWAKRSIDRRLNGLFVNWHDGSLGHYHGRHRDSTSGLVSGCPIVTISLGQERVFRMRPYPSGTPRRDFVMQSGDFIVIPWETNRSWTHEVPRFARYKGRRISVTIRGFA